MTDLERTNLEAHVDLCAQRYQYLVQRLDGIETHLRHMCDEQRRNYSGARASWFATVGTVCAAVASAVTVYILRF